MLKAPSVPMLLFERSRVIIKESKFLTKAFAPIEVILLFGSMIFEKFLLFLTKLARDIMYLSPYL